MSLRKIEVKDQDDLIDLISKECNEEFNAKKKLLQICEELGLQDTIMIMDYRTKQLVELHQYYKYSPHLVNVSIFQDAVTILNQYEPRGI